MSTQSILVRALKWLLLLALLLVCLSLLAIWYVGAWNLVFPNNQHDTVPPELPAVLPEPAILVFSKTTAYRHEVIPTAIKALTELGRRDKFNVVATEEGSLFTDESLRQFHAVVFLNTTGNVLNDEQQVAFERYIQAGGATRPCHRYLYTF